MYCYVDESGNTGANLFDPAQPVLYYGLITSKTNLDVTAEPLLRAARAKLGVERLHANELGVRRLSDVALSLGRFALRVFGAPCCDRTVFPEADVRFSGRTGKVGLKSEKLPRQSGRSGSVGAGETRRVSPPGPRGRPRSQNGISSSRSTSSGFSFSADFGRLRKSTFSAMISQP